MELAALPRASTKSLKKQKLRHITPGSEKNHLHASDNQLNYSTLKKKKLSSFINIRLH